MEPERHDLDALELVAVPRATHMQFVGATAYCSVKGERVKLDPDHHYGRSFDCPYCGKHVVGRLDPER